MKKNIAFHISTLTRGGAERVITNLANYFVSLDYNVYMLTELQEDNEYWLDSRIIRINLNMHPFSNRIKNVWARIENIRVFLKTNNIDILVSFIGKTNLRSITACIGLKTKVIVSVRSAPKREYGTKIRWILAKLLFGIADGVVFQTDSAKSTFPKRVQKKSIVLANSISASFIKERFIGERKNEIVTVGRLEPVKNYTMAIRAFKKVAEKNDTICLKIYGNGQCKQQLMDLIHDEHLDDRVTMMGDSDVIFDDIYKSRIFVQSSNFEGMPNSLMEAMSLGLAVVSTDCPSGGPGTLIKNKENGMLVPVNDSDAMATAIMEILSNPKLEEKMGCNASKISQDYTPEKIHKLWSNYIDLIFTK